LSCTWIFRGHWANAHGIAKIGRFKPPFWNGRRYD
jgi:hypothetical protein